MKGNAKMSDQDAVLAAVHDPEHVPSTDVIMPDSDYIGAPQDVVVTHNKSSLSESEKKSLPVKPLKLDGDTEQVKEEKKASAKKPAAKKPAAKKAAKKKEA